LFLPACRIFTVFLFMEYFLGIDIGGNHVKTAIVAEDGSIKDFQSYSTAKMRESGEFISALLEAIAFRLLNHKEIRKAGIGLPGMISRDRSTPIDISSIPELNHQPLLRLLEERFPEMEFVLENDANAAALGELLFSRKNLPETFAFITLGTGIGSAFVLDGKIFTGGDGNGLELGHIPSRNGRHLEANIGKQGLISLAALRLIEFRGNTLIAKDEPVSATKLVVAASEGDVFAQSVFFEVGEILGEGLVALIRILDVKTIVVGGGLSASFDYLKPGVIRILNHLLPGYYCNALDFRLASLGNDAGVLGAAALCSHRSRNFV
jgi:glucokinase